MGIISWIIDWFKKKEELSYPQDFALIEYSPVSKSRDARTKIILRYFINRFGNTELKKYRYSEERVDALEKIHKVPVWDKTKKDIKYPIYSRISPGEVRYRQVV